MSGAYASMTDSVQQALYDRGYTGDIRQDAYAVLDVALSHLVALLGDYGAMHDRNADWRDGVDEAAEYVRSLIAPKPDEAAS